MDVRFSRARDSERYRSIIYMKCQLFGRYKHVKKTRASPLTVISSITHWQLGGKVTLLIMYSEWQLVGMRGIINKISYKSKREKRE